MNDGDEDYEGFDLEASLSTFADIREPSGMQSISQLWQGSESQGPVKLILPDQLYKAHYLKHPPNRKPTPAQEQRNRKREEFMTLRELSITSEAVQKPAKVVLPASTSSQLSPREEEMMRSIRHTYDNDFNMNALMTRVKEIQQRRKLEEQKKREIYKTIKMSYELKQHSQVIELNHKQKSLLAMERKRLAQEEKNNLTVMRMKRREKKHMKDHEKLQDAGRFDEMRQQKWLVVMAAAIFSLAIKEKVDNIRRQKEINGPAYIAAITIQSWYREILVKRKKVMRFETRRAARRFSKANWKAKISNLKGLLVKTHQSTILAQRGHACAVITEFLRVVSKCFRGYVHGFLRKVTSLQRYIRSHQAYNRGRVDVLVMLFDRCLPPLQTHITVLASGKSLASTKLSDNEILAIKRMCWRSTDPLNVVSEMKSPDFHRAMLRKFPSEVRENAKCARDKTPVDNAVKRRVLLEFLYTTRKQHVRQKHEEERKIYVCKVTLAEVKDFVFGNIADPLSRNVAVMLSQQNRATDKDLTEDGDKEPEKVGYFTLLSYVTPIALAELYFNCRDIEKSMHANQPSVDESDYLDAGDREDDGDENAGAYILKTESDDLSQTRRSGSSMDSRRSSRASQVSANGRRRSSAASTGPSSFAPSLKPPNILSALAQQQLAHDSDLSSSSAGNSPAITPRVTMMDPRPPMAPRSSYSSFRGGGR